MIMFIAGSTIGDVEFLAEAPRSTPMQYGTTDAMSTTWDITRVASTPPHMIFYTVYAYALQLAKRSSKESFAHAPHSILHPV